MTIVARKPGTEEGSIFWTEKISWYGNTPTDNQIFRIGLLTTNCILRDKAIKDLKLLQQGYDIVVEATTVVSLTRRR